MKFTELHILVTCADPEIFHGGRGGSDVYLSLPERDGGMRHIFGNFIL